MGWGEKVNFVGNFTLILFFLFSLFFFRFYTLSVKVVTCIVT